MSNLLGERIKVLEEERTLFLLQLAPQIEIGTAQVSAIEYVLKHLTKDPIALLANMLNSLKGDLLTLWSGAQICAVVLSEELAKEAIKKSKRI